MANILYKQTEFGKWTVSEFLEWAKTDPQVAEWLDAMARSVITKMKQSGSKEFGVESAKELIAAAITKGFFIPKFKKVEEK